MNRKYQATVLAFTLSAAGALSVAGCRKKAPPPKEGPRPVTVVELRETNPVDRLQITGVVAAWKEQDVAFEVGARVAHMVERGTFVHGRWEEGGTVHVQGDALGQVDRRPYEIARDSADSTVLVAKEKLNAAIVQLEKVLPANLKAAQAEKVRAQAEWGRNKQARESNAISEVDFIRSTADRDAKNARYEQSSAAIDIQRAEIEALKATVKQAKELLEQAQYDLDRCTLYAPFSGEVSEIFVEAGGYAQIGQPVAHIVMMDPIMVNLSVSPATAARLELGDNVRLFLTGDEQPMLGNVYEKSTVADQDTRTFGVAIITRNSRTIGALMPDDPIVEKYPRIRRYMYLARVVRGDSRSSFAVEENRALRKDDAGHYIWAAPDIKRGDPIDSSRPLVTLRKIRVTPGEGRMNYQGIYLTRELVDVGNLEENSLVAMDVPESVQDGDQVIVAHRRWKLHPGQLVRVSLGGQVPKPGLYVPMDAIKPIDEGSGEVFVVSEGTARKVEIKITGNVGELFRIEAASSAAPGALAPGAKVITDYIHFLVDGEAVQVVRERKLEP